MCFKNNNLWLKNFIYVIDFLYQIKILLIQILKLTKILGIFRFLVQNSRFFRFFWPKLSNFRYLQVFPGFQVKWQPFIYPQNAIKYLPIQPHIMKIY